MAIEKGQKNQPKVIEATKHYDATRKNIPTAEYESVMAKDDLEPIQVAYERRNKDLDPQFVWRGKDIQDWSDLVVHAPPIYIQEKVHPKTLIEELLKESANSQPQVADAQPDLFGDFNGIPEGADKTDFYQHDGKWQNRMILGDSLQVMASLAEREGLRGQVQCIYFDPPYGIKFNSNFQWSTTSNKVSDGKVDQITREPEMVKAFRDTWRDGIHSYLTYLRDRLIIARDLLSSTGSIFIQIGDENVHRVRALLDEVFGDENFVSQITFVKTGGLAQDFVTNKCDYILWFAKAKNSAKWRGLSTDKRDDLDGDSKYIYLQLPNGDRTTLSKYKKENPNGPPPGAKIFRLATTTSEANQIVQIELMSGTFSGRWKTNAKGMSTLEKANRIVPSKSILNYVRFVDDYPMLSLSNVWDDIGGIQSRLDPKIYIVQTATEAVKRCILMASDPGDLVLDPTCGSGTTAYVAEQWGRRWITIDTSRVALALARARIMGSRFPFYILSDSQVGLAKDAEISKKVPITRQTFDNIKHGFVYARVPHIKLSSVVRNSEIDVIWSEHAKLIDPLIQVINDNLKVNWTSIEFPVEPQSDWPKVITETHNQLKKAVRARQIAIDKSIEVNAEYDYLYDKPYEDEDIIRVAGPFTVESLSPHRTLAVDENDDLFDQSVEKPKSSRTTESQERDGFVDMVLENLRTSGVQQPNREDKITFTSLAPWPGGYICAEGTYQEGDKQRRAGIFIGPEFGTVARINLVDAAKEAGEADFDVVISCAFNYDAHSSEFEKLGRIPVLKARMNADLHMADDLKNTGKGNLFVIFGEPDIDIIPEGADLKVKINGVDVFDPRTGEVRSDNASGIACWFIDTDYNGESFFVRHAYFLGANDPYKALKTTLKAEINEEAWSTLNSDVSRPFPKPSSGRIAVKVINHLGDEVMKVFKT